jgi:hypothetical protein
MAARRQRGEQRQAGGPVAPTKRGSACSRPQ